MPLDLAFVVHSDTLLRILIQKFEKQVLCLRRDVLRDLQLGILDVLIEFLDVLGVVRWEADQELVEDSTYLIDVTGFTDTLA